MLIHILLLSSSLILISIWVCFYSDFDFGLEFDSDPDFCYDDELEFDFDFEFDLASDSGFI